MNNKKVLISAFILVAFIQLYVPAKMIWDREEILKSGVAYKFKTAPIDPSDPFRGKYITLSYDHNTVMVENEKDWLRGEEVYVYLIKNNEGYAEIDSISKEEPTDDYNYLKTTVGYVSGNGSNKLTINFPFDRFYMEESKAYNAELAYRESQRDTSKMTYALVHIKKVEAVLKDVYIDGIGIREIVKGNQKKNDP